MPDRRRVNGRPGRPRQRPARRTFSATFLRRAEWWVAWSEDVPGALTQGKTLAEAKANLRDAIRLILEPAALDLLPKLRIVRDRVTV